MSKIYFRHKIQEGTQIKIPSKVYTGTDSTGAVFWKFVAVLSDEINGEPYSEIVEIAREYIKEIGGFEKFAEWGLF